MLTIKRPATKVGIAFAALLAASSVLAQDYTATCSTAGFTGTAYIEATREHPYVFINNVGYQIKAPSGQENSHFARLSVQEVQPRDKPPTNWRHYNTNLRQDNFKHKMIMRTYLWELGSVTQNVQFTFAGPNGSKPTCTGSVRISPL